MSATKAFYHLPGLFEFYDLYKEFLKLFNEHRDWFYDWCEIGSVYGAPADAVWGGGRVGFGQSDPRDVFDLCEEYKISARLTFSNSLLTKDHLNDNNCNKLCKLFSKSKSAMPGVIVCSDILIDYLKQNYPEFYLVSSTTKVITEFDVLIKEINREEFSCVVPDFRLNKYFEGLKELNQSQKDKVEFLVNECCFFGCKDRRECYENVSRKSLGENCPDHVCRAQGGQEGYLFSKAKRNPSFISVEDIRETYMPMGFSNFKIEGRSLGSAVILEFLLYYMTRPEYQLNVREAIYLDSMLDLF